MNCDDDTTDDIGFIIYRRAILYELLEIIIFSFIRIRELHVIIFEINYILFCKKSITIDNRPLAYHRIISV